MAKTLITTSCACGCGETVLTPGHHFRRGHNNKTPEGRVHLSVQRTGSGNPAWKGDGAGYQAFHNWLRTRHPKSGVCEECGATGERTDYSLIHGRTYSRDRADYRELCCTCHNRYDASRGRRG